jgi:alginate O-acetyltransferase complex protein AlgI
MEIISFPFVIFILVVLGIYHLLPRRGQNIWLLICSLYFAATWHWEYAVILGVSILGNFFIGRLIAGDPAHKKNWLFFGIALNTAGLLLFRLSGTTLLDMFARFFSGGTVLFTRLFLPIGFSFYTLQALSYLVDIYQKKILPEQDLIDFGLYLAYFPRLLSGPIERGKSLLPQLKNPRMVDNISLAEGSWLIITGLFRKLVLASLLFTLIPEGIFARPLEFAVSDRWIALLVYGFWLYNDFAGYTSLVRGISLLFGIRLSPNFKQPFLSRTMLEFWNRWHMSLSFWLRDYIFFPLQRIFVRRGFPVDNPVRLVIPPLVTMTISGLWHNATLSLIFWGLLHGSYQIYDHSASQKKTFIPLANLPQWRQALYSLRVYLLLLPTWILFTCPGLKGSGKFVLSLFADSGVLRIRPLELVAPIIALFVSILLDFAQEKNGDIFSLASLPRTSQTLILAFGFLCIVLSVLWMNVPSASFVYQGF